jgi:general secretion pathway protein G
MRPGERVRALRRGRGGRLVRSLWSPPLCSTRPSARSRRTGFTLIELLGVMAIVATLLSVALPRYFGSVERSKAVVLKQSLSVMRDAIDKFYADNGRYPSELSELATRRYLRAVPVDPVTGSDATWVVEAPPDATVVKGEVFDVHSGAPGKSSDGVDFAAY